MIKDHTQTNKQRDRERGRSSKRNSINGEGRKKKYIEKNVARLVVNFNKKEKKMRNGKRSRLSQSAVADYMRSIFSLLCRRVCHLNQIYQLFLSHTLVLALALAHSLSLILYHSL